ncbi:type 1 glutamine amidotransferase domain-containing protein [Runella sp.]|uniref:type 1 glutamine amidotransferase domain-containing protein n=1 Tax=Runella sp. TaxID=1960881 RepID=UPI003018A006
MNALIVVTNISTYQNQNIPTGLWLSELTHFYDACIKANISATIASPKGGKTPLDPESLKPLVLDKLTKGYYSDSAFMEVLNHTASLDSINIDDFDAIYLTGGHGTMYDFVNNDVLNNVIASFYEQGKIVAAVCHGVCGLMDVRLSNGEYLVKDKTITGYSWFEEILANRSKQVPFNLEKTLKAHGAHYKKGIIPLTSNVKQDGNLITGQNPFSSKAIAESVIDELKNRRK